MNRVTQSTREGVFELHTADPDNHDNRLQVFFGGNGDWYLGTLNTGRMCQTIVQVTGCGGGQRHPRVLAAVAELYRALKEAENPTE